MGCHTLTNSRMRCTWLAQHILIESGAPTRGVGSIGRPSADATCERRGGGLQHATIDSETRATGAGGAHRTRDTRERRRRLAHPHQMRHGNERRRQLAHPHRTRYGHNTRRSNGRHERWVEVVAATCGTRLSNAGRER